MTSLRWELQWNRRRGRNLEALFFGIWQVARWHVLAAGIFIYPPAMLAGAGRVGHMKLVKLDRLDDFVAVQLSGEAQGAVDADWDASGKDPGVIHHDGLVDEDGAEIGQQVKRPPMARRPASLEPALPRRRSGRPCTPRKCCMRLMPAEGCKLALRRRPSAPPGHGRPAHAGHPAVAHRQGLRPA